MSGLSTSHLMRVLLPRRFAQNASNETRSLSPAFSLCHVMALTANSHTYPSHSSAAVEPVEAESASLLQLHLELEVSTAEMFAARTVPPPADS